MKALLRITGPNLSREFVLDPAGAEVTLGRDPAADIQLVDPQKHISRKHLAVRQTGDGVELRIVSALNGVETSRGQTQPGQRSALGAGDHFTLGPYRIDVVIAAGDRPTSPAMPGFDTEDPFAALLGTRATAPRSDDPFARPEFRSAPPAPVRSGGDPFSELEGYGSTKSVGSLGPLGSLLGPGRGADSLSPDPLTPPHTQGSFGLSAGTPQLDDWLGGGTHSHALPSTSHSSAGPLDSFLGRASSPVTKALSPDHVQGIHMPMSFGSTPQSEAIPPAAAKASALPGDDIWANLMQSPGAIPVLQTQPASAVPAPSMKPANTAPAPGAGFADHVDIAFGDDPFDNWADTASMPLGSERIVQHPSKAAVASRPQKAAAVEATHPEARADSASTGTWLAFAQGLGLAQVNATDEQAAERAGVMVRMLIEGLAELLSARADLKRELRAEDRTMLSGRDNNPLKAKLSAAELVQYLFSPPVGGGYMPADRAVRESIAELRVHEHATIAASRAAVEGALRDFEPGRLRKQLTKGKSGLFQVLDNARLWEAYEQHYEKQSTQMADWLEAMFARHFMPTYARETERLKNQEAGDPAD